jgi:hypothetical protein
MVKKFFIFCVLIHMGLLATPTEPLLGDDARALLVNPYYLSIKKIRSNDIHRKVTNFDPNSEDEFRTMRIDVGEVKNFETLVKMAKAQGVMLLLNTAPISRDKNTKKLVIRLNTFQNVFSLSTQKITEITDYTASDFTIETSSSGMWCCKEEREEYYFKGNRIYLNVYIGDAGWIERWERISKLDLNTPVFFIESALHKRKKVPAGIALHTRPTQKTLE